MKGHMSKKQLRYLNISTLGLCSITLLGLTTLLGSILASSYVTAEDNTSVVDEINITVPISCTMSGTGMNSHNAEIANGAYTPDIGSTTLHAFCNDNEGFAIYAAGYAGDEVGGTNSDKLVGTSASGNAVIESGLATSAGNPDVSNWAMKLTMTQDSGDTTGTNAFTIDSAPNVALPSQAESGTTEAPFSSYHVVPNEYVKVAHKNSGTDMTATTGGVKLATTYAAYIGKTQPADIYSGQVIYTLVHPSEAESPLIPQPTTPNKITYYANSKSAIGSMGDQELIESDKKDWSSCAGGTDRLTYCFNAFGGRINIESLPTYDYYMKTLYASNFSREGYGFAGWNDKHDYSGNFYGPNETIHVTDEEAATGLALYAVWVKSAGNFQDANATTAVCNALSPVSYNSSNSSLSTSLSNISALTDSRDDQTYAIAKLADSNCWMIENLRLDDSAELSITNTNNPALPLTNDNGTSSNRFSATSNSWCSNNTADCVNQSMLDARNTLLFQDNTSSDQLGYIYSYGNYYNWYSATAGRGTFSTSSRINAAGDICPYGWRLPSGGTSGDIGRLDTLMGGNPSDNSTAIHANIWRSFPNNIIYSSSDNSRRYSVYASSTSERYIYFADTTINVVWEGQKNCESTIRCLLH